MTKFKPQMRMIDSLSGINPDGKAAYSTNQIDLPLSKEETEGQFIIQVEVKAIDSVVESIWNQSGQGCVKGRNDWPENMEKKKKAL